MRRVAPLLALLLLLPGTAAAAAQDVAAPNPPGAFKNVELAGSVGNHPPDHPETLRQATAINFLDYGDREVMVVVGRFGLRSYDLADPTAPELLDSVGNDVLALDGDTSGTFWQNEDMDVDHDRKLVFLARDPRAYDGTTSDPADVSGVYIVDAADPADLKLVTFHPLPVGHTSTCINDCKYLWTGGPAANDDQRAQGWTGRPVYVTDIRDPANPVTFPTPVDVGRDDGVTAYSHDVQVDANGVAWVSGQGGVRGYWTQGEHHDPLPGAEREATPWDPVPYGGGGIAEDFDPVRREYSRFMHNSERPVGAAAGHGHSPESGYAEGELIYATEEDFQDDCAHDGAFTISTLEGSLNGEAWKPPADPTEPFRLRAVGSWSVAGKEGAGPTENCSAHYFQLSGGIAAYSWYGQGTRFIDVTNPADPVQIAYYRPDVTASWAPYWHGDYVYVADHERGVDILRLTDGAREASATHTEVLAPSRTGASLAAAEAASARYRPDSAYGWACQVSDLRVVSASRP
jgi:hypothetical protein